MRVALDAGPLLDPPTGVGRYVRELGRALGSRGVDVRQFAVSLTGQRVPDVARWRAPARLVHRSWLRFGWPPVDGLVGDADVVHGTNFVAPLVRSAPVVVTIHDLSYLRDDAFPGRELWARMAPWSVERAARVIVPTEAVAAEVRDHFGVEAGRVVVTHEGVSPVFFGAAPLSDLALESMGIARPFAVAAGTIEPRKNLGRLVEAWRKVAAGSGWTLIVAGPEGWGPELPETSNVISLGWVGDETLPGLLAAADLFCYPSLYEGFGLPPLEAMAAGTACLVGAYPAAAEVVGDAAVIVDPLDVLSIASGLERLMRDKALRRSLSLRGKARAAAFTWDATAAATVAVYREALERSK